MSAFHVSVLYDSVRTPEAFQHEEMFGLEISRFRDFTVLEHGMVVAAAIALSPSPPSGLGIRSFQKSVPFFPFFSVLYKRTFPSFRSFLFFIKERNVLFTFFLSS